MVLWIAGAGGVGREALDVALAGGVAVAGFLDDARSGEHVRGLQVHPPENIARGDRYLVAIGDPTARLAMAGRLASAGGVGMPLVHPAAVVGPETLVGDGVLVMGQAHVSSSVQLGDHVQVQYGATVGHDSVLERGTIVLPGANVAGSVHVGERVTIGSGAVVLQGISIGEAAVIGAGSVVIRDVPADVVVVGAPARALDR